MIRSYVYAAHYIVGLATQVLAIPIKRCDKPLVGYLTQPEMEAILAVPDLSLWIGQRDHALLLTMYNSGGRVSEITGLSWQQVRFGTTRYLDLNGKGRKERSVPLWPKTAKVHFGWQPVHNQHSRNPTLTIVALAIRQADYIADQVANHNI